ncbi:MAG: glycosyl hydrolase [Bacteroidota bacterium]
MSTSVLFAQDKDEEKDLLGQAIRGLKFRHIGPAAISGRISDIAIHPDHPDTWYLATASGGVWKTVNAGTTFDPIADGLGSYSFGAIAIDPHNPNVVWLGSGENNPQRSVAFGDGVYKSLDGGKTWKNVGLKDSEHIARILIDPRDTDVVYVASQGPLWNAGGDRGLFKTTDGGETWTQLIDEVHQWSGVADAVMDPSNPDVLIAATWERARRQWSLIASGDDAAVYRSEDGGENWSKVKGMPGGKLGRVGLTISPADPNVVYAIAEATGGGGFYRSTNNGINFSKMSGRTTSSNYYQELFADPVDVDKVYSVSTYTGVTTDGGKTWTNLSLDSRHVDDHVVWVDPENTKHMLIGGDGGLYETWDDGKTWAWSQNLPLAQFYRVAVDSTKPFYRIYGGTQDNSTMGGPSRTTTRLGADTGDWFLTLGGDGFITRIDPYNQNIVYSEYQYAGLTRVNLETGERVNIQPLPEPGEPALRWNWDTPLQISPHEPARLYVAAQRVYRSDDRGSSWRPISDDLTAQIDRNTLDLMGRVRSVDAVAKNRSTSTWNSIVSMNESALKEGLIWTGSDDGVIQVTEDGGDNWRRIGRIRGAPDTSFVAAVVPSQHDVNTVYVLFDHHKSGDFSPYIFVSTDLGRSWESISGDLPEKGTAYSFLEDYKDPDLLYAGTEYGVFFSPDRGESWKQLKNGVPTIKVADLALQKQHDDLVLGTFGRGFYVLDDLEILRSLNDETLEAEATLLPVTDAMLFVQTNPDPGWQGAKFWTADNPPAGASIFYHMKEGLKTREDRRKKRESEAQKADEDLFYPAWDSLRAEDREEAPRVELVVRHSDGHIVARKEGRASAGLHRVDWNLRYPSLSPVNNASSSGGSGPYVMPGTYTVSMTVVHDGEKQPVTETQSFEVKPLYGELTPRPAEVVLFQNQTAELVKAVYGASSALNAAVERADKLEAALKRTAIDVSAEMEALKSLKMEFVEMRHAISGDPTLRSRNEPSPPSLMSRLSRIAGGAWSGSVQEVTGTQRRQYEIVSEAFEGIHTELTELIERELRRIEAAAEAAGAPWSGGALQDWRN